MPAAQGNRELVADLAAQGPQLGKANVMGIRGRASADQAWLGGYKSEMLLVANATRLREG